MDLLLSDDQTLLRDAAIRFISDQLPLEKVRQLTEGDAPVDPSYLRQAAELGWFAFFVPESLGGGSVSGAPVLDAAIVAEERGRALQPGPFIAANVVAFALAADDPDRHADALGAIAAGERLATWAAADIAGSYEPGAGVAAMAKDGGFVLSGVKGLVEDAATAQWFLVCATHDGGVAQFLVPADSDGVVVVPDDGLDITRPLGTVRFDDVVVPATAAVGTPGEAASAVVRQLDLAVVLSVAETMGAVDHLVEMTRQYAIDRVAFGRPIGSFQAIKHLLADLAMYREASMAGAVAAAKAVEAGRHDASETASIAKAFAGDAGIEIAQGCFQVHGGIGFTWEHDLHLYLRRITANAFLYGDADWHRERVCALHGL